MNFKKINEIKSMNKLFKRNQKRNICMLGGLFRYLFNYTTVAFFLH